MATERGAAQSVVEAAGTAYVEGPDGTVRFHFHVRDHFIVPSWQALRLQSDQGCVWFSYSDRPEHQALGIHREERIS